MRRSVTCTLAATSRRVPEGDVSEALEEPPAARQASAEGRLGPVHMPIHDPYEGITDEQIMEMLFPAVSCLVLLVWRQLPVSARWT